MKNQIKTLLTTGLLAAVFATSTITTPAQDKKPAAAGDAKKGNPNGMPFNGKINGIDKAAKTINIGKEKKRTISITSETKITKDGKAATLNDAVVGEKVGGFARENADGKLEAVSLRIGDKPEAKEGDAKPKKKKE